MDELAAHPKCDYKITRFRIKAFDNNWFVLNSRFVYSRKLITNFIHIMVCILPYGVGDIAFGLSYWSRLHLCVKIQNQAFLHHRIFFRLETIENKHNWYNYFQRGNHTDIWRGQTNQNRQSKNGTFMCVASSLAPADVKQIRQT